MLQCILQLILYTEVITVQPQSIFMHVAFKTNTTTTNCTKRKCKNLLNFGVVPTQELLSLSKKRLLQRLIKMSVYAAVASLARVMGF